MRIGLGVRLFGGDSLVWVEASGDIVWAVRVGDEVWFVVVVVSLRCGGAGDGCFISGVVEDLRQSFTLE